MKKVVSLFMAVVFSITVLVLPVSAAVVLDKPTISSAVVKSKTSVKLVWDKVDNAEKYIVYYSTEKSGTYKKYGVTSKTSAIIKNLEEGTTYYFRVRARAKEDGKTYYSKYSASKKCTTEKAVYKGIKVIKSPGTVDNNSIAILKIKGKPNTEYTCSVKYSSKWSEANGLGKKMSDENGYVTWEWKVGAKTKPGKHPIKISGGNENYELEFETVK